MTESLTVSFVLKYLQHILSSSLKFLSFYFACKSRGHIPYIACISLLPPRVYFVVCTRSQNFLLNIRFVICVLYSLHLFEVAQYQIKDMREELQQYHDV